MTHHDVIVLGGGAAGLSAALALGRARRRVLVLDEGRPRNRFAAHMHTVLGHEGLDPAELLERGRTEVARYGVEVRPGRAVEVRDTGETDVRLRVVTHEGEELATRALVLATGLTDHLPNVPGLAERWGTRVLHCPYCHGWEVRGERLAVLLTSPAGLHQAELVRQWSDDLTVLAGEVEVPALAAARLASRGVQIVSGKLTSVEDSADGGLAVRTAAGAVHLVDAIFLASRAVPNDGALAGLDLERAELPGGQGSFLAVDPTGRTSHERIWAAGNVTSPALGVAASAGAGTIAGGMANMALVAAEFDAAERALAAQASGA